MDTKSTAATTITPTPGDEVVYFCNRGRVDALVELVFPLVADTHEMTGANVVLLDPGHGGRPVVVSAEYDPTGSGRLGTFAYASQVMAATWAGEDDGDTAETRYRVVLQARPPLDVDSEGAEPVVRDGFLWLGRHAFPVHMVERFGPLPAGDGWDVIANLVPGYSTAVPEEGAWTPKDAVSVEAALYGEAHPVEQFCGRLGGELRQIREMYDETVVDNTAGHALRQRALDLIADAQRRASDLLVLAGPLSELPNGDEVTRALSTASDVMVRGGGLRTIRGIG